MDRDEFVRLLNEDLQTEYQWIVQYIQHLSSIKGVEYQAVLPALRTHLGQELEHALTLAAQIDFLGGVPAVGVPPIIAETNAKRALELDLELETKQLLRYRERVNEANDLSRVDVAEALRPLLEQTQDHVRDLQGALGL